MVVLTLIQSVGVILAAVYQNELKSHSKVLLDYSITFYGNDTLITKAWDNAMEDNQCCGVAGRSDFASIDKTMLSKYSREVLRENCFGDENPGCYEKLLEYLASQLIFIIIGVSAAVLIEISGIASALGLNNSIDAKDDYETSEAGWQMQMRNVGASPISHRNIDSHF